MASRHPVDGQGRSIPRPDWPTERAAPGDLERLRRFCNTANLESGADRLSDPAGLDRWLVADGYEPAAVDVDGLARLVGWRELLRAGAVANRQRVVDPTWVEGLASAVGPLPLRLQAADLDPAGAGTPNGGLTVGPGLDLPAADRLVAMHAVIVMFALRAGTWSRLKACDNCSWVFYDRSKNASGRWCSMGACGGRAKVRNHRRRMA